MGKFISGALVLLSLAMAECFAYFGGLDLVNSKLRTKGPAGVFMSDLLMSPIVRLAVILVGAVFVIAGFREMRKLRADSALLGKRGPADERQQLADGIRDAANKIRAVTQSHVEPERLPAMPDSVSVSVHCGVDSVYIDVTNKGAPAKFWAELKGTPGVDLPDHVCATWTHSYDIHTMIHSNGDRRLLIATLDTSPPSPMGAIGRWNIPYVSEKERFQGRTPDWILGKSYEDTALAGRSSLNVTVFSEPPFLTCPLVVEIQFQGAVATEIKPIGVGTAMKGRTRKSPSMASHSQQVNVGGNVGGSVYVNPASPPATELPPVFGRVLRIVKREQIASQIGNMPYCFRVSVKADERIDLLSVRVFSDDECSVEFELQDGFRVTSTRIERNINGLVFASRPLTPKDALVFKVHGVSNMKLRFEAV